MTNRGMTKQDDPTPEKFDLRSLDVAAEKRAELLRLFPECATEGGKIDFERLKGALGEQIDGGRERYGLTWPGKAACFQAIQRPSLATLRPKVGESVEFDATQNLIIEGDNLEVLKLLQKSYMGKVKMIYIDPPYNTGNDFIYPDNYTESLQTYLEYTGQVDGEGRKLSTNTEADGRFHSKWLNMMYPRLYLARNLLREDGVIFISIDDHEVENLRRLCGEIFGEEGLLGCVTWQKKYAPANDTVDFSATHDYVAVYARSRKVSDLGEFVATLNREPRTEAMNAAYSNPDGDSRGAWKAGDYTCNKTSEERPNLYYPIIHPRTKQEVWPKKTAVWRYSQEAHARHVAEARVWWGADGDNRVPAFKRFLTEVGGVVAQTVWLWKEVGHTDEARKELASLLSDGGDSVFDTPKPVSLIAKMLALATHAEDDIILDFFAGSGTTAHAVLEQNHKDGGNRKFILVQLPEPTNRTDYPTIADITKERVRRVIKNLNDADKGQLRSANDPKPDRGFRVFQLAPSNFKPWDGDQAKDPAGLQRQLFSHVEHVLPDRTEQDLLFEILLKDGFELTTPVETFEVRGFRVHSVANGELLLCLQDKLTHELIRDLAERRPSRVVFLDRGFRGNDQLKANAAKLFASKAGENFKKFKTV